MSQKILFLCHHGAAKSILGASLFRQAAEAQGLPVQVDFAGTEPDEAIPQPVVDHLLAVGIDVRAAKPRMLTQEDLANAAKVVSMGCPLEGFELAGVNIEHWDDVPAPSQDLEGAARLIKERVGRLVQDM